MNPRAAVLLFTAANYLFLIVDILLAHSYNRFASPAEWIPVIYSVIAGIGLIIDALNTRSGTRLKGVTYFILFSGVLVGIAGFHFHFHGATFRELSLRTLVYAAPLAAPFAYSGLALAALAVDGFFARFGELRRRLIFLVTAGGFAGNFMLSVFDHARNGFFEVSEWVPVWVSAFAMIVFFWAALKPVLSAEDGVAVHAAAAAAMMTGLLGFAFHLSANIGNIMPDFIDRFVYGAPVFAPLLFCDIALLGLIALLAREDFNTWVFDKATASI